MQRYFISVNNKYNDVIKITGEDVHHIKNVMRSSLGDQLICCDGQGIDYLTQIINISSSEIACRIITSSPSIGEPTINITIAQSLPKREKMEWILQKGTEIGATRFIPFSSERTIVKVDTRKALHKKSRWERIVKEAAEQAHRGTVPRVDAPKAWKELLCVIQQTGTALIAYEKGGELLSTQLTRTSSKDILIIIGPEGGFTDKEIIEAKEHGAIPISLGPRVLRTETAPLMALSCILYHSGDL